MKVLHPSVPKRCVPVMLGTLGEDWALDKLVFAPTLGLSFKHISGWEMRFYWVDAYEAFRCSHDSQFPLELLPVAEEAAAAASALVKLRGWDTVQEPLKVSREQLQELIDKHGPQN